MMKEGDFHATGTVKLQLKFPDLSNTRAFSHTFCVDQADATLRREMKRDLSMITFWVEM